MEFEKSPLPFSGCCFVFVLLYHPSFLCHAFGNERYFFQVCSKLYLKPAHKMSKIIHTHLLCPPSLLDVPRLGTWVLRHPSLR